MSNPITRTSKGAPLSHTELDSNFLLLQQLLQDAFAKANGENATGTWTISITGTANGISGVNSVEHGGTGASTSAQALANIGGYPLTNPNNFISAYNLSQYIPTRQSLMIDRVNNTNDEEKQPSAATRNLLDQKQPLSQKNTFNGYAGLLGHDIQLSNAAGTISTISSNATVSRQYALPNKNIVIAGLSDITGINSGVNTGDETTHRIVTKLGVLDPEELKNSNVTKASLGINKVENMSPTEIIASMTFAEVVTALGYTPQDAASLLSMLGTANGIATLGPDAFIKSEQLPPSILGGRSYKGAWNADTNTPLLENGGSANIGDFYTVTVAGTTALGLEDEWNVKDVAIYNGSIWDRVRGDIIGGVDIDDVMGAAASAKIDTTNASNINAGILAKQRLPAMTGDVIHEEGTGNLILNGTGLAAGNYGAGNKTLSLTMDSKNRITAISENNISLNYSEINNKPTTVAASGITDAISSEMLGTAGGIPTLNGSSVIPNIFLPTHLQPSNVINSIGVSGPLNITLGQTPTISITQASGSTSGYISAEDFAAFNAKQAALGYTPVNANLIGANNGLAQLGPDGLVRTDQLPIELFGGLKNYGSWNPNTNIPSLQNGVGIGGQFYVVSEDGTFNLDGNSVWKNKDLVLFNDVLDVWQRIVDNGTVVVLPAQIAAEDVVGLAQSALTDTTDASNISSGILAKERLPAITGDIIHVAGTGVFNLADTTVIPGAYGADNQIPFIIVNSKGQITDIAVNTINISDARFRSITLAGLVTNNYNTVLDTDSFLIAIGKLQAQVTSNKTQALSQLPFTTTRGFSNGVLIYTNIDYDVSLGDYWTLEITGNSSSNDVPFDYTLQGVIAGGGMDKISGMNKGRPITGMTLFNLNGELCFWFPSQGAVMVYNVKVCTMTGGEYQLNKVLEVDNSAKPGGITKEYSVDSLVVTALTSANYTTYIPAQTSNSVLDAMIYS